jgi:hypothetical protein
VKVRAGAEGAADPLVQLNSLAFVVAR